MAGGGLTSLPTDVEAATLPLGTVYLVFAGLITLYTSYLLYAVREGIIALLFKRKDLNDPNSNLELRDEHEIKQSTITWQDSSLSKEELRELMWRVWEDPYAAIAWAATRCYGGKKLADWMVVAARLLVSVTLTGVSIVFSVLASQDLAQTTGVLSERAWMAIVLSVVFLAAPLLTRTHDYQFITAVSALMTAAIAATTFALFARGNTPSSVNHSSIDREKALGAYGGILFMFGGHGGMPAYHAGMTQGKNFMRAVYLAYGFIMAIMLAIGVTGPVLYGAALESNLPDTFDHLGGAKRALTIFFIVHMVCAMPSLVGPVSGTVHRIRQEYIFCVQRRRIQEFGYTGLLPAKDDDDADSDSVSSTPTPPQPSSNDDSSEISRNNDPENIQRDKAVGMCPTFVFNAWQDYGAVCIVLGIVFVIAMAVRGAFLPVMGLLGATTITAVTFVLPCVFFYMFAQHEHNKRNLPPSRLSTRGHAIVCLVAGVSGLVAGVVATINNIQQLVDDD